MNQNHHISYEPEIKIDVCRKCHLLLHKHGVGLGQGEKANKSLTIDDDNNNLHQPQFTKIKIIDKSSTVPWDVELIIDKNDDVVLDWLTKCPNRCFADWQIYQRPSYKFDEEKFDHFILRCNKCGWDTKIIIPSMKATPLEKS